MNSLQVKNTIFNSNEILFIRKKGNIVINIEDIKWIEYAKPTIFNYLMALFGETYPGRLEINLNKKVNKTKLYLVKIKFEQLINLPEFYLKKIDPANNWGMY